MLEARLDRIIQLSTSILDEIQRGNKLSDILPQARSLAEINNDPAETVWIEYEIYGKERVTGSFGPTISINEQSRGAQIFDELHTVVDMEKTRAMIEAVHNSPIYLHTTTESIVFIEHFAISEHPELESHIYGVGSVLDKYNMVMALECERVLKGVRAAIHKYVNKVWLNAVQERENFALVGPDYKIVIDNLDALETGVGQVLIAALDNLRTENPEKWNLAALGCRNVIIRLGDILWKAPNKTYLSKLDEKELDLVGEKEKNRLYAYIDYHYQRIKEQEHKDELKQLHDMVWRIWDIGSKAKRSVRHEEAKTIVIDTFEFVNNLDAITELKPLEEI